jgi:hypothetical protein
LDVWNGTPTEVEIFEAQTGISFPLCLEAVNTGNIYGVIRDFGVVIDQDGVIKLKVFEPAEVINDIVITINDLLNQTSITEDHGSEYYFQLFQNYPNPFNPVTTFSYEIDIGQNITITIFDIAGQVVYTLVNGYMPAGRYEIKWNGTNSGGKLLSSGIYFYSLQGKDFKKIKKLTIIR